MTTEIQLGNSCPIECFYCCRIFMFFCDNALMGLLFLAVPEPVAFYPLNASYKTEEKENRQPDGLPGDVAITNGPYNEPGGAYMFYGTVNSYIEFPNKGGLDTRFSITLMCWVEPGGQDGPLFNYGVSKWGVHMKIVEGKLLIRIVERSSFNQLTSIITHEVLPIGKWVHVAASYDHGSGSSSLYINGHLRTSHDIGRGYQIATHTQNVRMGSSSCRDGNFEGKIAEMKVYKVAMNEAHIQTSIRQGSCIFPMIVVSLPSPMIPLIIETPYYLNSLTRGSRHPF